MYISTLTKNFDVNTVVHLLGLAIQLYDTFVTGILSINHFIIKSDDEHINFVLYDVCYIRCN